jgi:hypothetical protein
VLTKVIDGSKEKLDAKHAKKHGSKACVTEATEYQICGERASGGAGGRAGGGPERRQEVKFGVRHY